ncbi:MAG: EAL domain-containing protein [Motiliproteus sp.]
MRSFSWAPVLAGATILLLLTFLFVQAQKVDSINEENSDVLELLQRSQQLDGDLRQGLIRVYYDQHPNFDPLLQQLHEQGDLLEQMQASEYTAFRQKNTGVEYHLQRLVNMHEERRVLVSGYIKQMVLLKNAVAGLSREDLLARLAEAAPVYYEQTRDFRDTLLDYAATPTADELTQQADRVLIAMEDVVYALQDQGQGLDNALLDRLNFSLQHGKIVFTSRALVGQALEQLFRLPSTAIMSRLTQVYLAYHEQQERVSRYYRIALFITSSLLLLFLVVTLLRLRNTASHLQEEKEQAQITLGAIADGVVSADSKGLVSYMNRAAEAISGITLERAQGQSFDKVLPLYSQITHKQIENPVSRCLDTEAVIDIQQHAYMIRADGSRTGIALTATPVVNQGERPMGVVMVIQDVGEAQSLTEKLNYETSHDTLTGLLNRMTFAQKIKQSLDNAQGAKQNPILWHIDLDHFSVINDICGSKGGDGFLRTIAGELKRALATNDVLSRIGGDEFAILRPSGDPADALAVACDLRERLNGLDFEWQDDHFDTTATIGVVLLNQNYLDVSDVLMAAKSAVDTAREQGRNSIYVHTKDVYENSRKHELSLWVPRIKRALVEGRYRLYLQSIAPITPTGCLKPHHAEVLLRMEDEHGRIIPPIFIPAAEEYNLMPQLDRWVISEVCTRIADAHQRDLPHRHMNYSVNLSGTTLGSSFFLDFIRNLFSDFAIPTQQICFEITETAAIQNLDAAMLFIASARELGCKFALDDFGSGMSSFAYLKNLPVDYLKIDGAFVKMLAQDPIQYSIVKAINAVGQTMQMETIAEFVEDDDIIRGLSEIGVDYAQGYGIDQPRPWDQYFQQGAKGRLLSAATERAINPAG